MKIFSKITSLRLFFPLLLVLIIVGLYYKLFLFGEIPFPGDLLVSSYSPWFDYYKLPVKNPLISDVFSQVFLWKYLSIDQIKNLQLPLWNPYSFTGNPLLANYQSAVLHPFNILLFIPHFFGWGLFIFSQTIIAALATYLLLSCWIKNRLARATGSIVFALGGMMSTWLELGTAVQAFCWLPLTLFCVEKYITTNKLRYLILLPIFLSLTILAGFAQGTLYVFLSTLLFILFRSKNIKELLTLSIFSLLSLLISAPQLLPTLNLFNQSIRLQDFYTQDANFGLLPVKELIKFFAADYFGNVATGNYWGSLNYIEASGFIGTLCLPLIVFAVLFLKKNKIISFFLILLGLSLILGFENPFSLLIYKSKIPFLTLSFASRILFISVFAIAVLVSFSVDEILKNTLQIKNLIRCLIWSFAAFLGIILGTVIIYLTLGTIVDMAPNKTLQDFYLHDPTFNQKNFIVSLRNLVIPAGQLFVTMLLGILLAKIPFRKIFTNKNFFLTSILILFLVFDLGRYFLKITPFSDRNFIFPKTPSLDFLQKQAGIFRIGRGNAEVLPPNTWTFYNLQSIEGYDPLYLKDYSRYIYFLNNNNLTSTGYGRYAELSQKNYQSPFLDTSNVKFFIALLREKDNHPLRSSASAPQEFLDYRLQEKISGLKVVFSDKSSAILENSTVEPRAYFAKSLTYASTQQGEQDLFNSTFDPKKTTMLAKSLGINTVSGIGDIEITSYKPNQVELTSKTNSDEVLVLSDQFEDGWKAKIDNRDTEIVRANLVFRAIKVPAGVHKILFYYWPQSFIIGIILFGVATIIVFTSVVISRRNHSF